ncbi:MAG: CinA family protein [Ruminococcus sp.]
MQNGYCSECLSDNLDKTVTNVVKLLLRGKLTVSVAESCTGGLLSQLITSVPGSSEVFELGICTYSERMKMKFLGVPDDILSNYGVVSSRTALAMVQGLKKCSDADICISVTGIAGPGGGTHENPVGSVYIGFDVCGRQFTEHPPLWELNDKSRDSIRRTAAAFAFGKIEKLLMEAVQ